MADPAVVSVVEQIYAPHAREEHGITLCCPAEWRTVEGQTAMYGFKEQAGDRAYRLVKSKKPAKAQAQEVEDAYQQIVEMLDG